MPPSPARLVIDRKSPTPVKEQVRRRILADITSGRISAGARIDSINGLSRAHGLSRETVRQSLDSLVDRGFLIPEHGKGYFVARRRDRRLLRVGLLGRLDGVYIRPVYKGLTEELGPDAAVLVMDIQRSKPSLAALVESLAYNHAVDRLLVVPTRGEEEATGRALAPFRRYFKIAWLDRAPAGVRDATFLCDYREVVRLALAHLEACGISSRCYFSRNPADRSVFSTMRRAFRDIAGRSMRVLSDWEDVQDLARRHRGRTPLGVLTETDTEAVFLQSRILASGLRVPGQVSIVTCDNSGLTDLVKPTITAIDPGFEAFGREAARWIRSDAIGDDTERPRYVSTPTLAEKESCVSRTGRGSGPSNRRIS